MAAQGCGVYPQAGYIGRVDTFFHQSSSVLWKMGRTLKEHMEFVLLSLIITLLTVMKTICCVLHKGTDTSLVLQETKLHS